MTSKDVASLSSSLLKRGTRDRSHGFVLGRADSEPGPAAAADHVPTNVPGDPPPAPDGGGHGISADDLSTGDDPLARMVRGVVQRYNQAFPFDPFFGSPSPPPGRRVEDPPRDHQAVDPPRPEATDAAVSEPVPSPQRPSAGRGWDDPVEGSLGALAKRVERIVQQTVEAADTAARLRPLAPDVAPRPAEDLGRAVAGSEGAERPDPVAGSVPSSDLADGPSSAACQEVVAALRRGERAEAERCFARLTGLTAAEVDRMLSQSDSEALAAACRSVGMEQLQFVSLFLMTRSTSGTADSVDVAELKRATEAFGELSAERARTLLQAWRQSAGS